MLHMHTALKFGRIELVLGTILLRNYVTHFSVLVHITKYVFVMPGASVALHVLLVHIQSISNSNSFHVRS